MRIFQPKEVFGMRISWINRVVRAQAGAQYVIKNGYVASSVSTAVTSATAFLGITASPAPSQSCGCPTTSGITAATCGNSCADGTLAATYVTVYAQGTYTPMFSYPGLPSGFTYQLQSTPTAEQLVVVPEPSTIALAIAGVWLCRRRRQLF